MLTFAVLLYLIGGVTALATATLALWPALKHGNTVGGFNAVMKGFLTPWRAWATFAGIAIGVVSTTAASILSVVYAT